MTSRISFLSHFLSSESCQRDGTAHGQRQRIIRRFAAGALDVDRPKPRGFRDYWIVHGGSLDDANYRVGLELGTPLGQQGPSGSPCFALDEIENSTTQGSISRPPPQ